MDVRCSPASHKTQCFDHSVSGIRLHCTLRGIMDVSTALFTHYLVEIVTADQNAKDSAVPGPVNPGGNNDTRALPLYNRGRILVRDRQFRVPRVLNHFSRTNSRGSMTTYAQSTIPVNA